MLSTPSGPQRSGFQIAAQSCCFISLWHLKGNESIFFPFSEAGRQPGRKSLCGSLSSQNWTEPSAHLLPLPLWALWLSDLSFVEMSLFSSDVKTGAILNAGIGFQPVKGKAGIQRRGKEHGTSVKRLELTWWGQRGQVKSEKRNQEMTKRREKSRIVHICLEPHCVS